MTWLSSRNFFQGQNLLLCKFVCYANFSIVSDQISGGQVSDGGKPPQGAPPPSGKKPGDNGHLDWLVISPEHFSSESIKFYTVWQRQRIHI